MSPPNASAGGPAVEALRTIRSEVQKLIAEVWDILVRLLPPSRPQLAPRGSEPNRAEEHLRVALLELQGSRLEEAVAGTGELFLTFDRNGIWTLGTGGSHWALTRRDEVVVTDSDGDKQLRDFADIRGLQTVHAAPRLRDVAPGSGALKVSLEHDWGFVVIASPDGIAANLPVFELRTPDNRYLLLFGDGVVSEVPGDAPISNLIESGELHRWPSAV